MTDDAPAYWNAFRSTMGCEKTQHLLCTWHVDKNWRKQLKKIVDLDERVKTYKQLCLLRTEPDEVKFETMLTNFVQRTTSKDQTKEYGDYFKTYYSTRAHCWANCFRHHSFINTNMYLESMHKTLKYCVFEKKAVRRLDHAIYLVSVLFDQIYGKYRRMLIKPCATKRTAQIFKMHMQSKGKVNQFTIERGSSLDQLIVKDKSTSESYKINLNYPGKHECNLVCKSCKYCIDTFICSCRANKNKGEFCVHLHLISTVPKLLPKFELPDCRFFKYLNLIKANKAKLERIKTSSKSSSTSKQNSYISQKETCGETDNDQVSLDYEEAWFGGDYDGGEAWPDDDYDDGEVLPNDECDNGEADKQVGGDQDEEEVKGASDMSEGVTSKDLISSDSSCPIMCPLEAFDLEIKYGVQVWEQMKKEAKQNPDHFQKVLGSIPDLKESLVQFISEMLPLLKEPPCLQNHQNQFTAMNISKQIRFDSNPKKAGRKRQKTSMHMPSTPEKETIEKRLLDPTVTPIKKAKKTPKTTKTKKAQKEATKNSKKTNTKSNKDKNGLQTTVKTRRRLNL